MDFGNDMKTAASNALKCASQFGLFNDIYRDNELVELKLYQTEERILKVPYQKKVKKVIELNK